MLEDMPSGQGLWTAGWNPVNDDSGYAKLVSVTSGQSVLQEYLLVEGLCTENLSSLVSLLVVYWPIGQSDGGILLTEIVFSHNSSLSCGQMKNNQDRQVF